MFKPIVIVSAVLFILACDARDQSENALNVPDKAKQVEWYSTLAPLVYATKDDAKTARIAEFIEGVHVKYSINDIPDSAQACIQTQELATEHMDDKAHPAKVARLQNKTKQMLILQITALRQCVLNKAEYKTLFADPNNLAFQTTFFDLINSYKGFQEGDFSLYEASAQDKLLAYSLMHQDERIFIAFNFSYDIHQMPLPFGFMASTKVTFWQSDVNDAQTFVTSSPLMIRPFTAAIVIVD